MKKKLVLALASLSLLGILGGCENPANDIIEAGPENTTPIKLWVSVNQAAAYRELAEKFEDETGVEVKVVEVEEADDALLKDADAAADVIRIAHDQLGQLVESGSVYENEKYDEVVREENIPLAYQAASYQDVLYGYPASAEAMFLYYDKRVYDEEDLTTLDALTSKGKVGINIAEAGADYRLTPWFIANGALLYGEDGEDVNGTTLNDEQGLHVLEWVATAKSNPNIVALNADEISALQQGRISALFSGVWNAQNVEEILGENMGTVVYPKADFGDGEINLKAFSGVPIFVVNAASKNPSRAMDFAAFLSNEESQLFIFEELNQVPSNIAARENELIQNDQLASTVAEATTEEHSVLMPKLPEMKNFWPNMNALLVDTYEGKVSNAEMQAKLDKLVADVSQPAESE
ncbi:extracellular solute-binding protein [Enterococcus sp. LJL120]